MDIKQKIEKANEEAARRLIQGEPVLVDIAPAGEVIPGMQGKMITHSGPPIEWPRMCGAQKGAIIGQVLYEGWVKTVDEASIAPVSALILQARLGLRVSPWEDYAGIMRSMTDSFSVINTILNVVNVLVAGITVFIITYIDVTNRRRQIGIQRAIGITPSSIVMTYIFRAVFYALVASAIAGLAFLYVAMPIEARYPFHFPFGLVYLVFGAQNMTRASLILVASALVASFLPAWLSLRIRIMDAIWG